MAKSSRSVELLEFEIAFYQRLLNEKPNFVEALMALGEAYTRRGWHEKGLEIDRRLTQLKAQDPVIWYNLACSLSLLKRLDESLEALQRAMALGYDDFEFLAKDPDLDVLRRSPQFRRFLETRSSSAPS
ncbi:MAG: hypothetical protein HY596_01555 [Candidatus Omnitrophica bacterium]|nr:hypothetical protein [Candidatus Omnitrophota bacterium]